MQVDNKKAAGGKPATSQKKQASYTENPNNLQATFFETLAEYNITPPPHELAAEKFTRWGEDKKYWAIAHEWGIYFGNWSTGEKRIWFTKAGQDMPKQERQQKIAQAQEKITQELAAGQEAQAIKAQNFISRLPKEGNSPYLERKHISSCGVLFDGENLIIPMQDVAGKIWSFQRIFPNGDKRFLKDGKKKGCFHLLGELNSTAELLICEGFATGASLHEATSLPVAIAFDAGNLDPVAQALLAKYPSLKLVVCGDDDKGKEPNRGRQAAEAVALKHKCQVIFPNFSECSPKEPPSDWNDLHILSGLEEVKKQLVTVTLRQCYGFEKSNTLKNKDCFGVTDKSPPPRNEGYEAIARLAELSILDYKQCRETEAKNLGIRTSALDKEVKAKQETNSKDKLFPIVKAWGEPIACDILLNEIFTTIKRCIVCEAETAIAATLWIAFTWVIDVMSVAPIALITAPARRCGKTQTLTLIGKLVRRPFSCSSITAAAMFRVIDAHSPTLLIDEADSFLKEKEELRGIINSGHTRGSAYAIRLVGDNHEPKAFATWGAKVICGIGYPSETIMDRSIILELRRKLPSEEVERLRDVEAGLFERLKSMLARFAEDASEQLRHAKPALPKELNDRAQDNWEPLLAIADYAGEEWSKKAREAALKISGIEQEEVLSLSAELLNDIHNILQDKNVDRITTAELLSELIEDDLKPWLTYNKGKPITPRQVARRLGEYNITPQTIRVGRGTSKGYLLVNFEDAFKRYCSSPSTPILSVTPSQTQENLCNTECYSVTDKKSVSAQSPVISNNEEEMGVDLWNL